MPVLRVWGKEKRPIDRAEIIELASNYSRCVVDVGSGDAKGSLRYARSHPQTLVISIDSSFDSQTKTSRTALKKPEKGGAPNLLCIYANIKDVAIDLANISDHVRVILPWGDLLTGIAQFSSEILSPLAAIAKNGSDVSFIINAEIWNENLPKELSHLGEINPEFFLNNKDKFSTHGLEVISSNLMSKAEINEIDTTWSAKLMSSRDVADFVMATVKVQK